MQNEHIHTRQHCSIFDCSHLKIIRISGKERLSFLEFCMCSDIKNVPPFTCQHSLLLNKNGGIKDDVILSNFKDYYTISMNAQYLQSNIEYFNELKDTYFPRKEIDIKIEEDLTLMALQGPKSEKVMEKILGKSLANFYFKNCNQFEIPKIDSKCIISRIGFTGEDGFEIICNSNKIKELAERILIEDKNVRLAGYSSRNSLRIESGFCQYGIDLDERVTPIEANMKYEIGKEKLKKGGYLGSEILKDQTVHGCAIKRVGFETKDFASIHTGISLNAPNQDYLGFITSIVYSPILDTYIGMAYLKSTFNIPGTIVEIVKDMKVKKIKIENLPFIRNHFHVKKN